MFMCVFDGSVACDAESARVLMFVCLMCTCIYVCLCVCVPSFTTISSTRHRIQISRMRIRGQAWLLTHACLCIHIPPPKRKCRAKQISTHFLGKEEKVNPSQHTSAQHSRLGKWDVGDPC